MLAITLTIVLAIVLSITRITSFYSAFLRSAGSASGVPDVDPPHNNPLDGAQSRADFAADVRHRVLRHAAAALAGRGLQYDTQRFASTSAGLD